MLKTGRRYGVWIGLVFVSAVLCTCGPAGTEKKAALNRLSSASSPYLREHADNPVDWYEWGDEALQKAMDEDKPIIVSIGYASCHWCHVMEEESFMDTTVARLMNESFISIKIDREERPDIDQVYIDAAQLISGQAGWPLNAFALPGGKPFYAGTYFTKEQWMTLLGQVAEAYKTDKTTVLKQANAVTDGLGVNDMIAPKQGSEVPHPFPGYEAVFTSWEPDLDYSSGGLAGAPKFPMPVVWEFLLQLYHESENPRAVKLVTTTLDAMSKGGIYDHLAGGFARYSTDADWKVPHFEKMLYDNGQLVSLYAHAYQVTKNEAYADVVKETLAFIESELTSPDGGFYSSLNADSEGEEGTFYVWSLEEIESIVSDQASELFTDYYNVTATGNWESQRNVLFVNSSIEELAIKHSLSVSRATEMLNASKKKLLNARNKRVRPSLDNKILTSWNALMLSACVDAHWALGNPEYLDKAVKNASFVETHLTRDDGGLWRSYSNGQASVDAFLDDYAFLASAYIKLYQATFDIAWLHKARALADYTIDHFHDPASGYFYYTSDESTELVVRKIDIPDQVMPSSNAVMAEVLFNLGHYFSSDKYLAMSMKMISSLSDEFLQSGPYFAKWASLMATAANRPWEVAVMGNEAIDRARLLMKNYQSGVLLMGGEKENLPLLENKFVEGETIIYVCRDKICKLPVKSVDLALEQLGVN